MLSLGLQMTFFFFSSFLALCVQISGQIKLGYLRLASLLIGLSWPIKYLYDLTGADGAWEIRKGTHLLVLVLIGRKLVF